MVIITPILIAINVIVFFLTQGNEELYYKLGLNSGFLEYKFYWQPFTSMFMHGDLSHLAMNMVVLFQFGYLLENELKIKVRYLLLYFIGGLITSLISFAFISYFELHHNLVGASGALSVLFGWFAHKDKNLRGGLIIAILLISFVPLLMGMNIAWYAHLIGFIIGWIVAFIL